MDPTAFDGVNPLAISVCQDLAKAGWQATRTDDRIDLRHAEQPGSVVSIPLIPHGDELDRHLAAALRAEVRRKAESTALLPENLQRYKEGYCAGYIKALLDYATLMDRRYGTDPRSAFVTLSEFTRDELSPWADSDAPGQVPEPAAVREIVAKMIVQKGT